MLNLQHSQHPVSNFVSITVCIIVWTIFIWHCLILVLEKTSQLLHATSDFTVGIMSSQRQGFKLKSPALFKHFCVEVTPSPKCLCWPFLSIFKFCYNFLRYRNKSCIEYSRAGRSGFIQWHSNVFCFFSLIPFWRL